MALDSTQRTHLKIKLWEISDFFKSYANRCRDREPQEFPLLSWGPMSIYLNVFGVLYVTVLHIFEPHLYKQTLYIHKT